MTGLAEILEQVGRDVPLPATGAVTLLPGPTGPAVAAVLGFTAHHVIAADVDPAWLASQLDGYAMTRPLKPSFLAVLGKYLNAGPGGQDNLLVATGVATQNGPPETAVAEDPAALNHSWVGRALRYRDDVSVATVPGGLVTTGRGLAGRWEISVEVHPDSRGQGIGRALATVGRTLIPVGELAWAQVHPANVASLRAFLAAGFRPVGAEVLFTADTSGSPA